MRSAGVQASYHTYSICVPHPQIPILVKPDSGKARTGSSVACFIMTTEEAHLEGMNHKRLCSQGAEGAWGVALTRCTILLSDYQ